MEAMEYFITTHEEEARRNDFPTVDRIDELVCEAFEITIEELRSKSREGVFPTA